MSPGFRDLEASAYSSCVETRVSFSARLAWLSDETVEVSEELAAELSELEGAQAVSAELKKRAAPTPMSAIGRRNEFTFKIWFRSVKINPLFSQNRRSAYKSHFLAMCSMLSTIYASHVNQLFRPIFETGLISCKCYESCCDNI